ncbi:MAG: glycosyltransferase [Deltaproteobacteria bacterium]|nr:glycosyltransferase [Deltaproteobacteria bacterium]
MNILFVVSTLASTGPTNQLYNIVQHMDKGLFSPMILTLSPEPKSSLLPRFEQRGIPVETLGLSRMAGALVGASRLRGFVDKTKPDAVHTNGIRADMLAASCLKGTPLMATLRSFPYHDYAMQYGRLQGTYMAWRHLNALRKIVCPVACSKTTARLVLNKCGLNLRVVQNGVDDSYFNTCSKEQQFLIREQLGLPVEGRVFVSVGDLIIRKKPVVLIRSFLQSRACHNDTLLMIGDGHLRKECEELVGGHPQIRFVGHVHNVNDYLKASDYFMSASVSEGLPNVVMEAMASGLPAFLSEIDSHREILEINPDAGHLVPVENIDRFTALINESERMDYERMSAAASDIIARHLNARNMSLKYQQLYRKFGNGISQGNRNG